jgi:hypothetical protein
LLDGGGLKINKKNSKKQVDNKKNEVSLPKLKDSEDESSSC